MLYRLFRDTGWMVLSRATFHSRKISIALAPATKIATNVANATLPKWQPVKAIRMVKGFPFGLTRRGEIYIHNGPMA